MSTAYLPSKPIAFEKLKELRGKVYVVQHKDKDNSDDRICLTDGHFCILAYKSYNGNSTFTRYANNVSGHILVYLAEIFDVRFVSEYEEEEYGQLSVQYFDYTPVPATGSEKVTVPAGIYSNSVWSDILQRWYTYDSATITERAFIDEDHARCAAIMKSALTGKKEVAKLTAEDRNSLIYLLSKLVLLCNMQQKELSGSELRELKILLARSDGREKNPPLSRKEAQEVHYLMSIARCPDGKITKDHLNSDEWGYLGLLLARNQQLEWNLKGDLNKGDDWCIAALLDRVCKGLLETIPDIAESDNVVNAIYNANTIGLERDIFPAFTISPDWTIEEVESDLHE